MKRLTLLLAALFVAMPAAALALAVAAEPGSIPEQLDGCDTDYREAVL